MSVKRKVKETPIGVRVSWVKRVKELVLADKERLIDALQKETRKSRSDALISEIFPCLEFLHFLETQAEKALRDEKVHTPLPLMGKKSFIIHEPYGVFLVISPWNYPLFQGLAPILSALVCGNAVIYKPSEHTPLKGVIEDLLARAGVPSGYVQVVYGDGAVARQLIANKPDKIFFTGSGATGRKILAQAADLLIPVELELGGKDAMIVFGDVNLDRAVSGALWGALTNVGQACTGVERVYVERSIEKEFTIRVIEGARQVGDDEIGEMTLPMQVGIVRDHLEDALTKGAKLQTGENWDRKNHKVPPLVLTGCKPGMKVIDEETFGPVIPVIAFDTEEEAIALANQSKFGLTASVWSKDLTRADRVARALEVGGVSINNVMLTEGNSFLPFGGVKESGFGRYRGKMGFHAFTQPKAVLLDKDSKKIEANWYPYGAKKYGLFSKMTEGYFAGGVGGLLKFILSGLSLESHSQKRIK